MNRTFINERIFSVAAIVIASIAIGMVACYGQTPGSLRPLSTNDVIGPRQRCDHVVALLHRYGAASNNPQAMSVSATSSQGPIQIPNAELGDLQIIDTMRMPEVPGHGPRIAVVVANHSSRCVKACSVTAVAMLDRIHPDCPTATAKVDEIAAGQAIQIEITLPLESHAMGSRFGQVIGFQRLLIALDSFDEFAESDESNNLQVYAAATLRPLTPAAEITNPVHANPLSEDDAALTESAPTPVPSPPAFDRPSDRGEADSLRDAISQFDMTAVASDPSK